MTHCEFVETHLKLVVLFPQVVDIRHRHRDGAMIDGANLVHLLLVFPARATDVARGALRKLDIVLPDASRVSVDADGIEYKLVRLCDCLSRHSGGVVGQVVSAPDVVQIYGKKPDTWHRPEAPCEQLLGIDEVIYAELHLKPVCPDIRLRMLASKAIFHSRETYSLGEDVEETVIHASDIIQPVAASVLVDQVQPGVDGSAGIFLDA